MITCSWENGNAALLRHVTVNALITDGNKVLLVKRATEMHEGGKYCLPGGFMERDESLEEAVKREVREETGYEIHVTSLFRVNDNPRRRNDLNRQNVDFLYMGEVISGTGNHDHEIDLVHWVDLEEMPQGSEFAFDHYDNVQLYRQYKKDPFSLPYLY